MSTDTLTSSLHHYPLRGDITVPGDKSMSHRAAILAGLAHGPSRCHAATRSHGLPCTQPLFFFRHRYRRIPILIATTCRH